MIIGLDCLAASWIRQRSYGWAPELCHHYQQYKIMSNVLDGDCAAGCVRGLGDVEGADCMQRMARWSHRNRSRQPSSPTPSSSVRIGGSGWVAVAQRPKNQCRLRVHVRNAHDGLLESRLLPVRIRASILPSRCTLWLLWNRLVLALELAVSTYMDFIILKVSVRLFCLEPQLALPHVSKHRI